ncbi:uncharacterized protein LOC122965660 [Thunnus albacares]|uniref:uncharacterized protein LOC122965660 n=1 Tax=Thunnus albacares TaxID=8236 RepID=UPI001CF6F023|nr:uncharacterized protein LOC122965660 [Thunnus albacares]
MTDQEKCDSTTWIFSGSGSTAAVELIELGQIDENVKAKSDRLSVTANCSLVIKKVTVEDVGRYTCRQFKSGQQQGQDSQVHLSVVTMTEHKNTDKVTLNCSVSTYGQCRQTVKWVYEGNYWDVNTQHMKKSQSSCFANVTLTTSHLAETSKYSELFKCNVTDIHTGKVQLFAFSPQSSDFAVLLRFLIVSVGLAALSITVVSVNIWTESKGENSHRTFIIKKF